MRSIASKCDVRGVVACAVLVFGGGCQLMTNPFQDEFCGTPRIATPSVEGVRAADTMPVLHDRGFVSVDANVADGSVTHGPLFFEDGLEDTWSGDGSFYVRGSDVGQWVAWQARFAINLVAVPYSVIVTPPWGVMVSDGSPSRTMLGEPYDAEAR